MPKASKPVGLMEVTVTIKPGQLEQLFWALDGKVLGEPRVKLLRAAEVVNGVAKSTQKEPGVHMYIQMYNLIRRKGLLKITSTELKKLLVEVGGKPSSYNSTMTLLKEKKLIGNPVPKRQGPGVRTYDVFDHQGV